MINWIPIDGKAKKGIEYLVSDGVNIFTAHWNTPYEDKSEIVWFSNSSNSYIFLVTHYAEINLPE